MLLNIRTKTLVNNLLMNKFLVKEQPATEVTHFRNSNFKHKMTSNPAKSCLHTRNCRRRFIKNLLSEKRNENM